MTEKFVKADLKDGMIVGTRGDGNYLVFGNRLIGRQGGMDLQDYDDDLYFNDTSCPDEFNRDYDIMKVYKICDRGKYSPINMILVDEYLEFIWERTEAKRMTVEKMRQNLEELTNEKVEIEPSINEMIGACYCYCYCNGAKTCNECEMDKECVCANFEAYTEEQLRQFYEVMMKKCQSKL